MPVENRISMESYATIENFMLIRFRGRKLQRFGRIR